MDNLELYKNMVRIRAFEEKIAEILERNPGEIICPVHLYIGQEAVAVGVCANLRDDDVVLSTHRSHGHYLAKGGDMKALAAEIYGRGTGCSMGKGGSMHLCFPEKGLWGSSAIVAGTIPIAVGAALAFSVLQKDRVAVVFFGDGAVGEGSFYESLNFAALRKVPVLFVCENNLYSTHMPIKECLADVDICKKAEALGVPARRVDGNDVLGVYGSCRGMVNAVRGGGGPFFLECMTYRWRGHVGPSDDLDKGLRSREELDYWMGRCPIKRMETELGLAKETMVSIRASADAEVQDAIAHARGGPRPEQGGVWK